MREKKEKRQNWYFTFGSGQVYDGYFIKYFGTFHETRKKMCDSFGLKWSMQYSEKEWSNPSQDSIQFNGVNPKTKPTLAEVWGWREIK